jgi:TonB-dependent receptor
VLPSLAFNYKLTDAQNIRLSASRTLARPEYRELADITTRDVIGGVFLRGNPELVRTLVDNADLRWEWYPNAGEVLSAGVFAKRFQDPIERVFQATSSGTSVITFANAEGADTYGLELEGRKGFGFIAPALSSLSGFVNLTLVQSEVRLGAAALASTNANRRMVGQAPYVVNTGLTYASSGGQTSATILFNRVGERIINAGERPAPDVIELPRNVVDFSLRFPIFSALSGRFDARNLLDAPYRITQGPITREGYRLGRVYQAGFSWRP